MMLSVPHTFSLPLGTLSLAEMSRPPKYLQLLLDTCMENHKAAEALYGDLRAAFDDHLIMDMSNDLAEGQVPHSKA